MEYSKFKTKKIRHVINARKCSVILVFSQFIMVLAKKIKSISFKIIFIFDNVVNVKQLLKKLWDVITLRVHANINFAIYVELNGQAMNIDVIKLMGEEEVRMQMLMPTVVNAFMGWEVMAVLEHL